MIAGKGFILKDNQHPELEKNAEDLDTTPAKTLFLQEVISFELFQSVTS